jgi:sulfopyruvate decarboxylase subunit beta
LNKDKYVLANSEQPQFIDDVCSAVEHSGVNLVLQLPCGRIAPLLNALCDRFRDIPLSREEEGVGIAAGAAMAGAKPLMIVQSSGIGNMVNALMSLTKLYELPLPIFVSQRGVYNENIAAQIPMGKNLPHILEAMGIEYVTYSEREDLKDISTDLNDVFENNKIKCFLFSPKICEHIPRKPWPQPDEIYYKLPVHFKPEFKTEDAIKIDINKLKTRIEMLVALIPYIKGKTVVCNIGYPSRELYSILDQESNFYMLGSLGLVTSIATGVALYHDSEVVVIDGDGSLIMNPNALITVGALQPKNLTIICLDNGAYGSAGGLPTWTAYGLKLENLAKTCGISKIFLSDDPENLTDIKGRGPRFIRLLIQVGNAKVGTVGLTAVEIKSRFISWLSK